MSDKPHSRHFDRVEILHRLRAVEAGEMTLYERELVEQYEAQGRDLWETRGLIERICLVMGYRGTDDLIEALGKAEASNPATECDGSSECQAPVHTHGCFAERNPASKPEEA